MLMNKYQIFILVLQYISTKQQNLKLNTNKSNTTLQSKALNLKRYSEKIKLLNALAKNNVSLKNQILAKARENSKINSLNTINNSDLNSDSTVKSKGIFSGTINWVNHPKIQSFYQQKEKIEQIKRKNLRKLLLSKSKTGTSLSQSSTDLGAVLPALPSHKGWEGKDKNRRFINRRLINKFPLVRISSRLHKHIKSIPQLNSSLSSNVLTPFSSLLNNSQNQSAPLFMPSSQEVGSVMPQDSGLQSVKKNTNIKKLDLLTNTNIVYNFNNNVKKYKLTSILENSFFSINRLISKPVLNIKPNKVIINLFFYLNRNIANIKARKNLSKLLLSKSLQGTGCLNALCSLLSKKLRKPVELQLIRLHHPALESNILANTIGYIAKNSRKTFRVIMLKLFKSTKIRKFNEFKYIFNIRKLRPTALVGIRIKLGGRLLSQKIVPRFTSRTIQRGNLGKTKTDLITTSRFTNKNKRGAFSFTITMGHKFF